MAGCRWGPSEPTTPALPVPEPDADADAVDEASTAILEVLDLVQQVAAEHVGLSTPLAALVAMHTAHLELLEADLAGDRATVPPQPGARAALARVRAAELDLQTRLARLAGVASSGPFARALASMSASVAQHVAALPQVPGRGPA